MSKFKVGDWVRCKVKVFKVNSITVDEFNDCWLHENEGVSYHAASCEHAFPAGKELNFLEAAEYVYYTGGFEGLEFFNECKNTWVDDSESSVIYFGITYRIAPAVLRLKEAE